MRERGGEVENWVEFNFKFSTYVGVSINIAKYNCCRNLNLELPAFPANGQTFTLIEAILDDCQVKVKTNS